MKLAGMIAMVVLLGTAACGDDGGGATRDAAIDAEIPCDQQSDPTCCGAPDHDCLGGACVAGVCQPTVLASSVNAADLALAGDTIYFVQPGNGMIERMATDGSGRAVVATSADTPVAVAATADAVVWATLGASAQGGAIVRLATGETVPVPLSTVEHVPCDLALDATGAVWTNYGSGVSPYVPGELRALPTGGAAATIVPSLNHACGVAVFGTAVYYAAFGTNTLNPLDGQVATVPRTGGAPLVLASNRSGPRFIAVTGSHVYWTEEGTMAANYQNGRVMRMSRSGGLPEVLADEVHPRGIVADNDAVYWMRGTTVQRLTLADRVLTTMATLPDRGLTNVVADATAIYFLAGPDVVTGAGGQILRLAK